MVQLVFDVIFTESFEPTCILRDTPLLTLLSGSVHKECRILVELVEELAAVRC